MPKPLQLGCFLRQKNARRVVIRLRFSSGIGSDYPKKNAVENRNPFLFLWRDKMDKNER